MRMMCKSTNSENLILASLDYGPVMMTGMREDKMFVEGGLWGRDYTGSEQDQLIPDD